MLDVGFSELLLVALVAILVLGPDRLPDAIRSFTRTKHKFQQKVMGLNQSFQSELGIDELKRQLHNEDILKKHPMDEQTRSFLIQSEAVTPSKKNTHEPTENA